MDNEELSEPADCIATKRKSSDNMLAALQKDGFMLIPIGSATEADLVEVAKSASRFFRTPSREKSLSTLSEDCGYRPRGIEYSQSRQRPDPIESFTASPRIQVSSLVHHCAAAVTLYEQMLTVIGLLEPTVEAIAIQLAEELSGSCHRQKLRGAFHRWSCLQANYSRPCDIAEPLIHELHEDGHLLTAAWATSPGLEVQMKHGQIIGIPWTQNEILVMPGEIAWLLSGGEIQPLYHRVRRDSNVQERVALLFFGDIDPARSEPWIKNDLNENVDIGTRIITNARRFGLSGFTPDR